MNISPWYVNIMVDDLVMFIFRSNAADGSWLMTVFYLIMRVKGLGSGVVMAAGIESQSYCL